MTAVRQRRDYRGSGSIEAWVWRIVVNEARRLAREPHAEPLDAASELTGNGHMYVKHFVDRQRQRPRRSDVRTVRIRFADGSATTLTPTRGYILWAASEEHLDETTGVVGAEGLGANGSVVARQSLKPPK